MAPTSLSRTPDDRMLLFDFGGVVQKLLDDLLASQMAQALGIPAEVFLALFVEAVPRIQVGQLSEQAFLEAVSSTCGVKLPGNSRRLFTLPFLESSQLFPNMTKLLDELLANKVRLGVLSNTIPSHAELNRSRGNYRWFGDDVYLSCEIGLRKPDPESFLYISRATKLEPYNLILVDDDSGNVDAARRLGMQAILHDSETMDTQLLRDSVQQLGIRITVSA